MKLTEREKTVMHEAFMTGRVYSTGGEKETPGQIHMKLHRNCENALQREHPDPEPIMPAKWWVGIMIATILGLIIATFCGCETERITLKDARRLIRHQGEDKIVSHHMGRQAPVKKLDAQPIPPGTNAEAYFDAVIEAKLSRNWLHIPQGGLIAVLTYVLRDIRKKRHLHEQIKKGLNGAYKEAPDGDARTKTG